jgi:hypothetical protein
MQVIIHKTKHPESKAVTVATPMATEAAAYCISGEMSGRSVLGSFN